MVPEHTLWIILMVVAIGVGIIIILNSKNVKAFDIGERNVLKATIDEDDVKVICNKENIIQVKNINFEYEGKEKELNFFIIGEFNERIAWSSVINYPEDEDVIFELKTTEKLGEEFIRLTFWKKSMCVEDYKKESEGKTEELIKKCPIDYLGSTSTGFQVNCG